MTYRLILRLCAARGEDLRLDGDLLQWVEDQIGFATGADRLPHLFGLTGDLSGAWRLAQKIAPDAAIRFRWDPLLRQAETVADRGGVEPIVVRGPDLANVLLAAALAAHAQGAGSRSADAGHASNALERRA